MNHQSQDDNEEDQDETVLKSLLSKEILSYSRDLTAHK